MPLTYKEFKKKLKDKAKSWGDNSYNDYDSSGRWSGYTTPEGGMTTDELKEAVDQQRREQQAVADRVHREQEQEWAQQDAANAAIDANRQRKGTGGYSRPDNPASAIAADLMSWRQEQKAKKNYKNAQKNLDVIRGTKTSDEETEDNFKKYRTYLANSEGNLPKAQQAALANQRDARSTQEELEKAQTNLNKDLTPEQQGLMRDYVTGMPGMTAGDYEWRINSRADNKQEMEDIQKAQQAQQELNRQGITGSAFKKYQNYMKRVINAEDNKAHQQKIYNETHTGNRGTDVRNSIGRSIESVAQNLVGSPGAFIGTLQKNNGSVDINNPWFAATNQAQGTRSVISKNIENGGGGKLGSFAYQAGMSTADSVANMALGAGVGKAAELAGASAGAVRGLTNVATLSPIAMNSFGSAFQDAKERGLSDAQAYGLATVNGAAEVLTEKVSLDNLWDVAKKQGRAATRTALGNLLASGGIEGSEEVASDFIDEAADRLISGNKSEYNNNVRAYQKKGLSLNDAKKQATRDFFSQVGQDFAGGAAGGLVFGGGALAANARNYRIAGQTTSEDIRGIGERYAPENTNYATEEQNQNAAMLHRQAKNIADRMDQGKRVSRYERANFLSNAAEADMDSMTTLADSMTPQDVRDVYEGIDTSANSYLNENARKAAENTKNQAEDLMNRMNRGENVSQREKIDLIQNIQDTQRNAEEASKVENSRATDRTSYRQINENEVPREYQGAHYNTEDGMRAISQAKNPTELATAYHASLQNGSLPEDLSSAYGLKREGMIRSGQTTSQDMERMEQAETPAQAYMNGFNTNETGNYAGLAREAFNAGRIARNNEAGAQSVSTQDLNNFQVTDEDGTSYDFNPRSIVSGEDNVISIKTDNGVIPINRLSTNSSATQTLLNNVAAQDNPETAKSFIDTYNRVTSQYEEKNGRSYPIRTFASMYDTVNMLGQIYGDDEASVKHVMDMRDMGYISSTLGQENVAAIMQTGANNRNNETINAGRGNGTVTFDGREFDLTDDEKQVKELVSWLADKTGSNVTLTRSGNSKQQGSYNSKGQVRLNLDSSNLFTTISHEMLGEYSLANAPEAYHAAERAWADQMIHRMGLNRFGERVRTYQNAYRTSGISSETGKTYNEALDEYFNDNLSFILFGSDENIKDFYDRMKKQEGKKQAKTFFGKVADFLQNVKQAFQNFLENHNLTKEQRESVQIGIDRTNHVYDLVTKMVGEARENNQKQVATAETNESQVKDLLDSAKKVKRFSISAPVEEKGDLIAVHNLQPEELMRSFQMGGLTAPSIAIIRSGMEHSKYGSVSVLFYKDTIDPKNSRYNRLYGADAWTPTFPHIEYELNSKTLRSVEDKIKKDVPSNVRKALGGLYLDESNVGPKIKNANGNFAEAYKSNKIFQYAWLKNNGVEIEIPTKEGRLNSYFSNDEVKAAADLFTPKQIKEMYDGGYSWMESHPEAVEKIRTVLNDSFRNMLIQEKGVSPDNKLLKHDLYKDLPFSKYDQILSGMKKYKEGGIGTDIDELAFEDEIAEAMKTHQDGYEDWLSDLSDGLIKSRGIRNKKDYMTPSGNRRSFKALHYDVTAENVVKAMREEEDTGNDGAIGVYKFTAAAQKRLGSIRDVKNDESRIRMISDEDMEELKEENANLFSDLVSSIAKNNSFESRELAEDVLTDAVKGGASLATIRSRLNKESEWVNLQSDTAERTYELAEKIRNLPTGYFEAKPMRVIGADEIAEVILPSSGTEDLQKELESRHISYETYKAGDEEERREKLNSASDVRFSIPADIDKKEAPNNILGIMDENADNYEFFGLRADDRAFKVGEEIPNSHQWWGDDPEDGSRYNREMGLWDGGELSGTSAVEVKSIFQGGGDLDAVKEAIKKVKEYNGQAVYLIGSEESEGGNDPGEIILSNPKVLAVFNKPYAGDIKYSLNVPEKTSKSYAYDYSRYSIEDTDFDPFDMDYGIEGAAEYNDNKEFLTHSLEDAITSLRGEWKISDTLVNAGADFILKKYGSSMDKGAFRTSLRNFFNYMESNDNINYSQMMDYLMDTARSVVDQAAVDPEDQKRYDDFRKDIRNYKLKLSDTQRKEVEYQYGSWKDFFGEAGGIFRQNNETGQKLDDGSFREIVNLAREYGIMIDPETAEPDQPKAILDAVETLTPQPKNTYIEQGANMEELSMDVAANILDYYYKAAVNSIMQYSRMDSFSDTEAMREAQATIRTAKADLEKKQIAYREKVKKNFNSKVKEIKDQLKQSQADYARLQQTNQKWYDKVKALSDENLTLQAKAQARAEKGSIQEYQNGLNKAKYRKNIRQTGNRLLRYLNQPTNTQHIPDIIAGDVADLVRTIDWVGGEVKAYQDKSTDARNAAWTTRVLIGTDENGKNKYEYFNADTKKAAEDKANEYIIEHWPNGKTKNDQRWIKNLSLLRDHIEAMRQGNINREDNINDALGDVLAQTFDNDVLQSMTDLIENSNGLSVRNLDLPRLEQLSHIMDSVSSVINRANKTFVNRRYATVEALARDTIDYTEKQKAQPNREIAVLSTMKNFLNVDQMEPVTYFDALGPAGRSIYRAFRDGQDVRTFHLNDAIQSFDKMLKDSGLTKKDIKAMEDEVHNIGDQKYTTAQIMSLYVLKDREQALQKHIIPGGIVPDTFQKGAITYNANVQPHAVTPEQLETITNLLTPEQKKLATAMRDYLSQDVAEWGNHASREMYGYSKFTERYYFPIKVYSESVDSSDKSQSKNNGNTSLYAVVNMASSKNLDPNARNALVVQDIFDAFTNHINDMATYDGFALPLLDSMKWFNFREYVQNEDGASKLSSIKGELRRIGGKDFQKYFLTFLQDINGVNETDESTSVKAVNALVGNYKGAAIGGNLRVVIQQPTAYARATAEINDKYLIEALGSIPKAGTYAEKAQKHSGIALWKSWGFYETNIGPSVKAMITGLQTPREAINEKANYLASKADDLTWGLLWRAAELEVSDKNPDLKYDSKEYISKVNDRFSDIIEKTQVVDSTTTNSQIMRRKGFLTKTLTAFMAEPTKSYNMLLRGFRGGKRPFMRAVKAYIFNAILTALAASAMDAMRDRDKEPGAEGWMKSYIAAFKDNALSGLNPLEIIPVFKDLWDTIDSTIIKPAMGESSYSSGSTMYNEGANNIIKSVQDVIKYASGTSTKTAYGMIRSAIRGISQISGIPAYNMYRDLIEAPITTLSPEANKALKPTKGSVYNDLYDAVDSGKGIKEAVQKIRDEKLPEDYSEDDEKKVRSGISSAITKKYKDTLISYYDTDKTKAASLKRDLIKAFQAAGYDRDDANDKINKWLEPDE